MFCGCEVDQGWSTRAPADPPHWFQPPSLSLPLPMEASLLAPSVSSHAISYVQELDASDIPTPFPRELLPSRSRSSLRSSVRSTKSTTQRAQVQLIGQHSSTENVTQTRTALAEALSVDRLAVRPAARTTEPEVGNLAEHSCCGGFIIFCVRSSPNSVHHWRTYATYAWPRC